MRAAKREMNQGVKRLTRPAARAQGEKAAGSAPETDARESSAACAEARCARHFSRMPMTTAAGTTPGASRCSDGRRLCCAARREALRRVLALGVSLRPRTNRGKGGMLGAGGVSGGKEGLLGARTFFQTRVLLPEAGGGAVPPPRLRPQLKLKVGSM